MPRGIAQTVVAVLVAAAVGRSAPARAAAGGDPPGPSTAFFYGANPPTEGLSLFDRVVLEPAHVTPQTLAALAQEGVTVYAYVSVGELLPGKGAVVDAVPPAWRLGQNAGWGGTIVDPAQPGWRAALVAACERLWGRGFRGFFLDTLDSYEAVLPMAERPARARALVALLRELHERLPGVHLLLNRGFSLFPDAAPLVDGVVAESLFASWNPKRKAFEGVSAADRTWLLGALREVRDRHHLPVTVIDYLPLDAREPARAVAREIAALGFVPWVSVPALDRMGVGLVEPVTRRVLVAYDGREGGDVGASLAHRYLALPLEHLGYAVDYVDASAAAALPAGRLGDRYAAFVAWFADDGLAEPTRYRDWLLGRLDEGMRVALLGRLGFVPDPAFLRRLGFATEGEGLKLPVKITRADRMLGFEAAPAPLGRGLPDWIATDAKVKVHLELVDATGRRATPVVSGPWGGLALHPFVLDFGYQEAKRWILDPFAFLERVLGLGALPALDLTSENGLRLLTVQADGDGFASRAETPAHPYAAEVVRDELLKRFPLPTTVSIVEGEIGPDGLTPRASPRLEALARDIFRLPHVAPASHAFSHPSRWQEAETQAGTAATKPGGGGAFLPIPGYTFDLRREIDGSVGYLTRRLLPPGKTVSLFLWTGDGLPSAAALAMSERLGLLNVSGETGFVPSGPPSLTTLAPSGRPVGGLYEVYAPFPGEASYTSLWRAPVYDDRQLLDAFARTESPRRLKAIGLRYPFQVGSKPASVRAVKRVYEWALAQEARPIGLDDYARRVDAFQRARLGRRLDGGFELRRRGALRTLRLPARLGWPDLARSTGVIGVRDLPQGRYVALAGEGPVRLALTPTAPTEPHLVAANGEVVRWRWDANARRGTLRVRGGRPVRVRIGGCAAPQVMGGTALVRVNGAELSFTAEETGDVEVACP